ncbi:MAG TPA: FG-GAP-like repeat-containing protein [Planctomycetota bacterium]|nr:FG-GAP-like repeat-containing protein [Planctomycetota bacterium]
MRRCQRLDLRAGSARCVLALVASAAFALRALAQEPAAEPSPTPVAAPLEHRPPFQARVERPLAGKPEGLCSGDFDGDGRADLAATLVSPGALLTWPAGAAGLAHEAQARACGDFPLPPLALPRGAFGAEAQAQAIAVASRAARTLELFGGGGSALALERTPRAMAAGKLGDQALIAVACDGRKLELLRDGDTQFTHYALSADLPRCALVSAAASAVLVGFQDSTAVEAYAAEGGAPIGAVELGGIPRALTELDVDGDHDRELLVAGGDGELWIFGLGAPGGAKTWFEKKAPVVWTTEAIPTALAVADFDQDGRADLALLSDFSLSVQILTRLGAAGAERRSYYVGQTPCGLASLDADGDGRADIAVANRDTQGLGLALGDGAGGLEVGAVLALEDFPMCLAAAKSSGPKHALRLVALNAKSNSVSAVVLAEDGLRSLPGVPCGFEPHAPQIAELDDQPGLDVVFLEAGRRGARLRAFHGDPAGTLSGLATLELGHGASDLALVDVDGDGKPEIAACDPLGAAVSLFERSAARADPAALANAATLAVTSLPRALTPIELDGDPALELACVCGAPGERIGIAWLDARRTASGALELAELGFTPLVGAPKEAAAADLDGDGDLDIAVLVNRASDSEVGAWMPLLRGPASATDFTVGAPIGTGHHPRGIAAADADGDGCAEVFVSVQTSTLVEVWTRDARAAQPSFVPRAFDSLGVGRGPLDLCLSDADGDGVLDLCVANAFSNDVNVLYGTRR